MQRCIQLTGTNRSKICPSKKYANPTLLCIILYEKKNSGGYSGGVTPVPISNTAVKSSSAHGTRFSWESGSLPVFFIYILLIYGT